MLEPTNYETDYKWLSFPESMHDRQFALDKFQE